MPALTRRQFIGLSLAAAAPGWLAACAKRLKARNVNFFNWSAYIGKETLPRFKSETGVDVNYEEFSDEEEMFAKLRSGAHGYDLIVGTDYLIPRLTALNLIDLYPAGAIKNRGHLDERFRHPAYDRDEIYTLPYLWGMVGIGYNKQKLAKAPTSWRDLWDAQHAGRIGVLDNVRACVSIGLLMSGFSETTKNLKALEEVRELYLRQKPLVKQYNSSTYVDSLVNGETHLAMAWSGDILQSLRENPQLDFIVPKEGSFMWVDNLCLVRGSEHREDALALADFLLRGEVAAEITNTVRYASPNAQAKPFLDKALLGDPRIYPTPELFSRLRFYTPLDAETTERWTRTWSDVKI